MEKIYNAQKLYNYGLYLLGRREYSEHQIREKMSTKSENAEFIQEAIDKLKYYDYLNDTRKAESIVSQYASREKGMRLMQRFKKAGINTEIIEAVLPEQTSDEKSADALKILERKYRQYNPEHNDRYVRALISRGFNYATVKDALNSFKKID